MLNVAPAPLTPEAVADSLREGLLRCGTLKGSCARFEDPFNARLRAVCYITLSLSF